MTKEHDVLKQVAENIEEKVHDLELFRQGHLQGVKSRHANDPKFQYFQICTDTCEVVLPVLSHVHKKTLFLKDYTLSIGHAQGLAKACEFFHMMNINRIILDNSGVDDQEFSNILKGA